MDNLHNKKEESDRARKELGRKLKLEIQSSGKTYKEIAKNTGLTYSYISDLANGKYLSTVETLYKICKYLGCDIKGILNGVEYWIKPQEFTLKDVNNEFMLNQENLIKYYDCLEKEIEKYEKNYGLTECIDTAPEKNLPRGFKFTGITAQDDSMELIGIYKGDTVTFEEGSTEPESDRIYAINYKGIDTIRKIYVDGDNIIIIPMSRNTDFKIEKTNRNSEDFDILGLVSSLTIKLI